MDGAVKLGLPRFVKKELEGYLDCGLLCRGCTEELVEALARVGKLEGNGEFSRDKCADTTDLAIPPLRLLDGLDSAE